MTSVTKQETLEMLHKVTLSLAEHGIYIVSFEDKYLVYSVGGEMFTYLCKGKGTKGKIRAMYILFGETIGPGYFSSFDWLMGKRQKAKLGSKSYR